MKKAELPVALLATWTATAVRTWGERGLAVRKRRDPLPATAVTNQTWTIVP
jgi:hypothetical protein